MNMTICSALPSHVLIQMNMTICSALPSHVLIQLEKNNSCQFFCGHFTTVSGDSLVTYFREY
jgi:hypothetical protein